MNEEELQLVLEEGEGHKIEFKEALMNIDKELVAFANSSGGRIFLGITDDKKSVLRNPNIAGLLHRVKYIEKMGTGINKMRGLMAEAGRPPIVFEFGAFFTAIFQRERIGRPVAITEKFSAKFSELLHHEGVREGVNEGVYEGVKARLVEEIAYLYTQGGIKRTEMETSFEISTATAERDLSILKRLGLLVFEGAPKTGRYVLTEKGKKMVEELKE